MMTTKTDLITETPIENWLHHHGEDAWAGTLTTLLRWIHEVDKNATQIWFAFYPLSLFQAFQQVDDPGELARQLLMKGVYPLKGSNIDASHKLLFGHRYWPEVKRRSKHLRPIIRLPEQFAVSDQILRAWPPRSAK